MWEVEKERVELLSPVIANVDWTKPKTKKQLTFKELQRINKKNHVRR